MAAVMKRDGGVEYPAEAYAYVGDPQTVDTWKIRLWETPELKVTVAQLGRAAAAFSPGGFRGQPVDLPAGAEAGVKAKIRAAYGRLGVKPEDVPKSIAASEGPRFMILLTDPGEPGALVRIALAKIGTWWKGKQKIRITREMLSQVIANFRKRPNGEVPIDYEHGIVYAAGSGEAVPAAGWIKGIEDAPDEDGILWALAEWTERAAEYIRNREYKYFSPAIEPGTRDNQTGVQQGWTLTSGALTNTPVLQDLPAIALSEAGWSEEEPVTARKEKRVMQLILSDRATGKVRVVHDDMTEETGTLEGLEPQPKVITLSEVGRTKDGRLDFAPLGVLPEGTLIASEVMRAINVEGALQKAVDDGKILPTQRQHYEVLALSDLDGFNQLVASMKPQIELGELGIAGGGATNDLKAVDAQIKQLAEAKQGADKDLSYSDAARIVLSERPDLKQRRRELMK